MKFRFRLVIFETTEPSNRTRQPHQTSRTGLNRIPSTPLGVGHWGQGAVDAGGGGGHGEQRGDGEGDAGGGGLVVQPEAHPGHAHRH